ncbi:MAG: hypothetical protein WED33_05160 [Bacteroidia bacterium]
MKKFILLSAMAFAFLLLNSCNKCTSCSVFDSAGNAIYEDRESCGNNSDIEKIQKRARDESSLLGGSYTCTDPN